MDYDLNEQQAEVRSQLASSVRRLPASQVDFA